MRVRYQFIVEVEADGMMGPLKVLSNIQQALESTHAIVPQGPITLGKVRLAACYPVVPPEPKSVVERVPGVDQSREVDEIRDRRIT